MLNSAHLGGFVTDHKGSSLRSSRCTRVKPCRVVAAGAAAAKNERIYNFGAGPAMLPDKVLKKAQDDLCNLNGCGMSIMEVSHRSKEFKLIMDKTESDLRQLLSIPDDYAVLFLHGGASTMFSDVPTNLCSQDGDAADFIVSGSWANKAFKEAAKKCKANIAWKGDRFTSLPSAPWDELKLTPGAKYLHICANETIDGVEFKEYPEVGPGTVLVADMSSNMCSKPVDVTKFGLIFASAQKNLGPAGVTIVIVRKDLLGNVRASTSSMSNLKVHADNGSLYNTPPCFAIYVCGLVFEDLLSQGGLEAVERKNVDKAALLYDAIDSSEGFYKCAVDKSVRSLMNVPFTMASKELEAEFLKEAESRHLLNLKGHRSVGGIRASIYNAMPIEGVQELVWLMKDFHQRH